MLPALLFGLISCNAGGGDTPDPSTYTITFSGTNCFLKNSDGDEITSPVTVNAGVSLNYTVFVKDTETYEIPTSITITDGVDYKYTSKTGELSINNVSKDIKISATAVDKTACNVYYLMEHSEEGCSWSGPEVVDPNTEIVATAKIADGYTLEQENITVVTSEIGILTEGYTYDSGSHKLTIGSEYACVGYVGIIGYPQGGQPGPTTSYKISFNMPNATADFPEEQELGKSVEGIITANPGYRCPIKQEMVDNQWLVKIAPSSIYHFKEKEFMYIPYTDEKSGASCAYLYIDTYYLTRTTPAQEVQINGDAIKLVTVTFDPNAAEGGHWSGGSSTEIKIGVADKGTVLNNIITKCSAFPVIDVPGKQFDKWINIDDVTKEVITTYPVEEDINIKATFKDTQYKIYHEETMVKNAEFDKNLPEYVKYHEGVGTGETKPTVTAKKGFVLPQKEDIHVYMDTSSETKADITENVNYILEDDRTKASFSIPEGIIDGNIYIYIEAYIEVTVTFSTGEGTWQDGTNVSKEYTAKKDITTYDEALAALKVGGDPKKDGASFAGWYYNDQRIDTTDEIVATITVTAHFKSEPTFEYDSWANFITQANKGFDSLYEYYGGLTQVYIGAVRHLAAVDPITGLSTNFTVRLIDINHDTLVKPLESGQTKATLTFEFVDLINKGDYAESGGNNWENSTYRASLDTFYNSLLTKNKGFAAKQVKKKTIQGKSTDPEYPEEAYLSIETNDYLFPLSGAEIGISGTNHSGSNQTKYDETTGNEGTIYTYYSEGYSKAKKYKNSVTEDSTDEYWLRSPNVHSIYTEGELDDSGAYSILYRHRYNPEWEGIDFERRHVNQNQLGYMAAFCI